MTYQLLQGDNRQVLRTLPDKSVHCIVTSPPYFGLRDYGVDGQIGLEETPAAYVAELVTVFRECWRVLRDDGTLWLNLGDSYANDTKWGGTTGGKHATGLHGTDYIGRNRTNTGLPSKCLMGIPWRVAFALVDDGWILRSDIIWHKPNPMPESVTDRPTKAHEYIFLLTKSQRYYYDADAVRERTGNEANPEEYKSTQRRRDDLEGYGMSHTSTTPGLYGKKLTHPMGRNRRSVWTVATQPYAGAHFATFPPALIEPCILAGCPVGGVVLDPFNGSGTTGAVACAHGRDYIGIDLSADYIALAHDRIRKAINESGRAYVQPVCSPSDLVDLPMFGGAV